ncbi:hypothetical protein [uncultured Roseobacter sp.]|uniref:hypothetical protein n=1 Tax=uncultured Roseobacter sp. TaxID=114847 RepID=UPI00260347CA|nr:hypothetical protein [uncultured Roseobacter sp.]
MPTKLIEQQAWLDADTHAKDRNSDDRPNATTQLCWIGKVDAARWYAGSAQLGHTAQTGLWCRSDCIGLLGLGQRAFAHLKGGDDTQVQIMHH